MIEHGVNGFLVTVDEPEQIVRIVDRCLQDEQEAVSVADKGRILANKMTWLENAERNLALYNQLKMFKQ